MFRSWAAFLPARLGVGSVLAAGLLAALVSPLSSAAPPPDPSSPNLGAAAVPPSDTPVSSAVAAPGALSWTAQFTLQPLTGRHIGLQIGHFAAAELPAELADLRPNGGAVDGEFKELDVNYAVTVRAATLLRTAGATVDVLPATVPHGYHADAFVAIHADQDPRGHARGFKITGSPFAAAASGPLASALGAEYQALSGLPVDARPTAVTPAMRLYYAFNFRKFQHAVAPSTPAAIIEMGFISDPADRNLLFNQPDRAAAAIAAGVDGFLSE